MKNIEYQSNPHHILLILASHKAKAKTEGEIQHIAFGKKPHVIRQGLDALERRGFIDTREVFRTRRGREFLLAAYGVTDEGLREVQRLARLSPGNAYNGSISEMGLAKNPQWKKVGT